jgi:hypothetical protein
MQVSEILLFHCCYRIRRRHVQPFYLIAYLCQVLQVNRLAERDMVRIRAHPHMVSPERGASLLSTERRSRVPRQVSHLSVLSCFSRLNGESLAREQFLIPSLPFSHII